MDLLARREHSFLELCRKLTVKGFDAELAEQTVEQLHSENLQSDERFTEQYVRQRTERGYGPIRISQELKERGISGELIATEIDDRDPAWRERLAQARDKRFGGGIPKEMRERARQQRFLTHRGFSSEQIRRLMQNRSDD